MKVKAAKGIRCPMENRHRQYIADGKTVEVPDTPYYRRMVADGSLVLQDGPPAGTGKKTAKEGGKI